MNDYGYVSIKFLLCKQYSSLDTLFLGTGASRFGRTGREGG